MDFKELLELIHILEESGLAEIEVEEEGRRIRLQKSVPPAVLQPFAVPPLDPTSEAPAAASSSPAETEEADEAHGPHGCIRGVHGRQHPQLQTPSKATARAN